MTFGGESLLGRSNITCLLSMSDWRWRYHWMNYTVSVSVLWETCVYSLQTSEPRIHPEMPRTDGPKGSGSEIIIRWGDSAKKAWLDDVPTLLTALIRNSSKIDIPYFITFVYFVFYLELACKKQLQHMEQRSTKDSKWQNSIACKRCALPCLKVVSSPTAKCTQPGFKAAGFTRSRQSSHDNLVLLCYIADPEYRAETLKPLRLTQFFKYI